MNGRKERREGGRRKETNLMKMDLVWVLQATSSQDHQDALSIAAVTIMSSYTVTLLVVLILGV